MTINSIANTVDAHIEEQPGRVSARDDVSLIARESDTLVVLAGGVRAAATRGSAVGAAVAYNYIGGSFDIANPDVVNRDSDATDQITAYIDNARSQAGGDVIVSAGYVAPTTPAPTTVSVFGAERRPAGRGAVAAGQHHRRPARPRTTSRSPARSRST